MILCAKISMSAAFQMLTEHNDRLTYAANHLHFCSGVTGVIQTS
jgi:hypothetical protein